MIRAQLAATGRAVSIADDRADLILDAIAQAYAEDPDTLGRLLTHHAATVDALDTSVMNPSTTDHGRLMAAAECDGSRDAIAEELPEEITRYWQLSPREAVRLADDLTARAALAVTGRCTPKNRKTA